MSLLTMFRRQKSAGIAKDRLHIIIAQERAASNRPDYLAVLRGEILEVVAKYTKVDLSQVKVELHTHEHNSILELNVLLPESASTP